MACSTRTGSRFAFSYRRRARRPAEGGSGGSTRRAPPLTTSSTGSTGRLLPTPTISSSRDRSCSSSSRSRREASERMVSGESRGGAVLDRHGETEWTISGQHTGRTDIALTERGRNEARLLAPLLSSADFALVLSSPLRRARETCELVGLGTRMEIEPDLMEWDYGEY